MISSVGVRFEYYLFESEGFPQKSEQAISDSECMEIAREIIEQEAVYWLTDEKEENIIRHYEDMKVFFIDKFGDASLLVEDLQYEIDECKKGYRNGNRVRSYYDDLLRIRAVFDLYE